MTDAGREWSDTAQAAELRRALDDARSEVRSLQREVAQLRVRLLDLARERDEPHRASVARRRAPAGHAQSLGRTARLKHWVRGSPLYGLLLPAWRLYDRSGMRASVNRGRRMLAAARRESRD